MKTNELKKGTLYSDRDRVNYYLYLGEEIALYDFERVEIDEDGNETRTGDTARLTSGEVAKLEYVGFFFRYMVYDGQTPLDGRATIEDAEKLAEQYKREDRETTPDDVRVYTIKDEITGSKVKVI